MAERTTAINLIARVSNYVAGMEQARQATEKQRNASEDAAAKFREQNQAMTEVGQGLVAVGALALAGVGIAVAKYAEFDQAISNVKAATQETTSNMELLRQAALDAGADTIYSASEAAAGIEELGKAGLTTTEILNGGLDGALSLAAAGQLSVADAAQSTAIALKQFQLGGEDASHVADLLAAGAGKAVGDVDDLSQALNQAGLVANGAGFSIEETTGVLAAFADAGLLGSDAGTSLKTAIIALQNPSEKAKRALDEYGISVYDTNGQMLSFSELAGQLEGKLGGLTDEQRNSTLATIFGNDALRAANVLYEQGTRGIDGYIDRTNDAGYAAQVAADRTDNLIGDLERLSGSIDTALIRGGSGANDVLRGLTQTVTGLVDGIGSLPQPALNVGLAVAAVGGAIALSAGAALVAVPKYAAFRLALTQLNVSGRSAALGLGGATAALTVFTLALGAIAESQAKAANTASAFEESFEKSTGAVTSYTRELVAKELAERNAFAGAERAGISQKEFTDAVLEGGDALKRVRQEIEDSGTFFDVEKGLSINAAQDLGTALDTASQKFRDTKAATEDATSATEDNAAAVDVMAEAADSAAADIDTLKTAIEGFGAGQLGLNAATREFEASLDDLTSSIEQNGLTLDAGTEAGRANGAALDAIASSALQLSAATLEQTGSQDQAAAAIARGREQLILALGQFGITGAAADAYADSLGLIPSNVVTTAQLNGIGDAQANLDAFIRNNQNRIININARATMPDLNGSQSGNGRPGLATGGRVYGPGTETSDSIAVRLSTGEHVWTAREVRAAGGHAAMEQMRREVLAMRGYATGGPVEYVTNNYSTAVMSAGRAPSFDVIVSAKGGVDLLQYVDVKIQQRDDRSALSGVMGKQVR